MRTNIEHKRALVTGASRGIGLTITESLLEEGCAVIGISKNPFVSSELMSLVERFEDKLIVIASNLNSEKDVHQLCVTVEDWFGGLDIIVNNAGIFHFETLSDSTEEMLTESFSVNIFAPFRICKYFAPLMIEQNWGRIINICSSSAYNGGGTPKHCIYSATKHALLGFSRSLDEELRDFNIRVGTVSPGGVNTDMVMNRTDIPKSTLMNPEDVAEAVMYLITSEGQGIVYEMRLWRMHR